MSEAEILTPEEVAQIQDMVKTAVGYDEVRGDKITVENMQFDNELLRDTQDDMKKSEDMTNVMSIVKYVAVFLIAILVVLLLRSMAKTLAEAMNPPVPKVNLGYAEEEDIVDVPPEVRRSNEILERVEMMTREEPVNIANIIRQWLMEPSAASKNTPKKK